MKFTKGYWVMREGVRPYYPSEAYNVEEMEGGLRVYAPTHPIHSRGATLGDPLITIELTTPMEGVIGVRAYHYAGGRDAMPSFDKFDGRVSPVVEIAEETASLTSGSIKAVVTRNPYSITFYQDGEYLTDSSYRNLAYMLDDCPASNRETGTPYMVDQLHLGVGEMVYGLGERFTPYVKNGQVVEMWNEDGGTSSEIAYKNVPFYLTNRGYGVFVDHSEKVFYEIASEKVSRVSFGVPGEELRYYIIAGKMPLEVLSRYTALTGRPALPPAWSFGLWLTTSFTTNYDEETTSSFIQGMADRDIPLHVFHFDCFWMREFNWCDFEWDKRVFPDPAGMLKRYHERGLKICVWINPYIGQRSPLFAEGAREGYLLKRPDGSVWQWDLWQPGMAIVDFTNPAACAWYESKLKALLDMGVDCFKTDFGERVPTDVVYHDGSDPQGMHNYYTHLYNQLVFRLLERERGVGEACLFARSATAGGQQFPVHWGGDCSANYDSMAETLRGGLSLAQSGFAFWSHDISGFEATATPDVYKRWCAFGLLSTHSRLHGSTSYRVPWNFDDEASDVLRHFAQLKCRLMPYIFGQSVLARDCGYPVMRPMMMEFPVDRNCAVLDQQYMLGGQILAAPILNERSEGICYLPKGTWTHLLSGERMEGGVWHEAPYDYFSLPLFVRENTLLPFGANAEKPDYDYAKGIELRLYALQDGAQAGCTVPDLKGCAALEATAQRQGSTLTLSLSDASQGASFLLMDIDGTASITGGKIERTAGGLRIVPESTNVTITFY